MTDPGRAESYTRDGFRALLEVALSAGYTFASFDAAAAPSERVCLLRHDVDADPGAALELAEIEADAGVRATYFFMLRSPLYNLFGRGNHQIVETIVALGHWLGLHYDPAFPDSQHAASEAVAREAMILADEFGVPVRAVSFHQPASTDGVADIRSPGLVSAFDLPGFRYVSDANKTVTCGELFRLFREVRHARIQLLVHPLWWATDDGSLSCGRLWERAILANLDRAQEQLIATERAYGGYRAFRIESQER
jgi:hypothetical protein